MSTTKHTRRVPERQKVDVAIEPGVYLSAAGVARVGERLVATFRRSDEHCAWETSIMSAHSDDDGATWSAPRELSRLTAADDGAMWVAPELNAVGGGELMLIVDRGEYREGLEHWPLLAHWQRPELGMSNHLFSSGDGGETWTGPTRIDDVGGEPSRITRLRSGRLIYTRVEGATTPELAPPHPEGWPVPQDTYYRNVAVASDDDGATWSPVGVVSDDPRYSDCEVDLLELPDRLLAFTRIGHVGGGLGQQSRMLTSRDDGATWGEARWMPFSGQRPIPGLLPDGRILVVYRNWWGTNGTRAFAFGLAEPLPYSPASYVWEEDRTVLDDGALVVSSGNGPVGGVEFRLTPADGYDGLVTVEAEVRVLEAEPDAAVIRAGVAVRITSGRVELADRPEAGVDLDATQWHRYRVERGGGSVRVHVDDELAFVASTHGIAERVVGFGNRAASPTGTDYIATRGVVHWRSVSAHVANTRDVPLEWSWTAGKGFPDAYRRDRELILDPNGSSRPARGGPDQLGFAGSHSGYCGWTIAPDGRVVVVDYTAGEHPASDGRPFIRAYRLDLPDFA
jgi:hypothetical protein